MRERLQFLEEKIAYLERHVTEQDKAMLGMVEELAVLRRELQAVRERTAPGADGPAEGAREGWDERPPHH